MVIRSNHFNDAKSEYLEGVTQPAAHAKYSHVWDFDRNVWKFDQFVWNSDRNVRDFNGHFRDFDRIVSFRDQNFAIFQPKS